MKQSKFTDEQILRFHKQADAGISVKNTAPIVLSSLAASSVNNLL